MNRLVFALILVVALSPALAHSTSQQGGQVMKNWKSADQCAKDAQAAFPDFTVEANAKRDAKLKECLAVKNLAPRDVSNPAH